MVVKVSSSSLASATARAASARALAQSPPASQTRASNDSASTVAARSPTCSVRGIASCRRAERFSHAAVDERELRERSQGVRESVLVPELPHDCARLLLMRARGLVALRPCLEHGEVR